jgi:hypothetical protein
MIGFFDGTNVKRVSTIGSFNLSLSGSTWNRLRRTAFDAALTSDLVPWMGINIDLFSNEICLKASKT